MFEQYLGSMILWIGKHKFGVICEQTPLKDCKKNLKIQHQFLEKLCVLLLYFIVLFEKWDPGGWEFPQASSVLDLHMFLSVPFCTTLPINSFFPTRPRKPRLPVMWPLTEQFLPFPSTIFGQLSWKLPESIQIPIDN